MRSAISRRSAGPVYWIRNIAYQLPGGSTRLTGGVGRRASSTTTRSSRRPARAGASNVHWRNNLFLGENSAPAIFSVNTYTNYTSSDYNGFRPTPTPRSLVRNGTRRRWNVASRIKPAHSRPALPGGPRSGSIRACRGPARATRGPLGTRAVQVASANTAQATRRIAQRGVDYDIFMNVPEARRPGLGQRSEAVPGRRSRFPVEAGSAAVDRGVALPNVTDGFAGQAPDLGALEVGQEPPHYGPRKP